MSFWRMRQEVYNLAKALFPLTLLWTAGLSSISAEERPTPEVPGVEDPPAPTGERPRVRYWLRDPSSPQEARPESLNPAPRDTTPNAWPQVKPEDPEAVSEASAPPSGKASMNKKETEAEAADDFQTLQTGRSVEERRKNMRIYFTKMLQKAKLAFKDGDYNRCEAIARNVLTADPRNVEAIQWLEKAHEQQADADDAVTRAAAVRKNRDALLEAEEHSVRPPVRAPEVRPHFPRRSEDPSLPRRKKMDQQLEQRVTVDFMEADLEWVLNTFFILTGINIIADPAALEDKKLTVHVEDLPLRSVLDFIVRNNDGIQYSVTEDAIWITATDAGDLKKIMTLRIYPIHYGLTSSQGGSGGSSGRSGNTGRAGRSGSGGGKGGGGGGKGGGGGGGGAGTYLETILAWLEEQQDPQTFPEGSKWTIDYQSNQIAVFTTPAGHDKLQGFLDAFDQPAIQVLIKARFLTVSMEDNNSLGFDIASLSFKNPLSFTGKNTLVVKGNTPISQAGTLGEGASILLTGLRTNPAFQITMNALLSNRNTRILSEPQILAINNKESSINITTNFSYITNLREVTGTTFGGDGTATQDTVAYVPEFDTDEIGFTLFVTPSVGRDLQTINLHINPTIDQLAQGQNISDFQKFTVVEGQNNNNNATPPTIQRPTIDQVELETDVVLQDNGYVIIGGLIQNRYETIERKVPGLHRIPYLGNLFKSKSQEKKTSNLVVIIEAQIITSHGRTYRTEPAPDDGDVREGGVNRAPGQVSELNRPPAVNGALGLERKQASAHTPGSLVDELDVPLAELPRHYGKRPGQWSISAKERKEAASQAPQARQNDAEGFIPFRVAEAPEVKATVVEP